MDYLLPLQLYANNNMFTKILQYVWFSIKFICSHLWNSILYVLSLLKKGFPWTLCVIIPSIVLFIYMTIRLLYPFWSWQPIYHKYDIWRMFKTNPYIINETIPPINKYYNPRSILTTSFLNTNEEEQRKIISFLQSNYTVGENIIYLLSLSYLQTVLSGHSKQTMISIQRSPEQLPFVDIWLGLMISFPVQMVYNQTNITTANYWYTITSDKFVKNKNSTRELIQTHERKCRNAMIDIKASLFKKEVYLCDGVVPTLELYSYTFLLPPPKDVDLPTSILFQRVSDKKYDNDIIVEFIDSITTEFQWVVYPSLPYINQMLKKEYLFMYMLTDSQKKPIAYYVFKHTCVFYEESEGYALQLLGSFQKCSPFVFQLGLMKSLHDIIVTSNKREINYKMLWVDSISHNAKLDFGQPIFKNRSAYYTYNMIYPKSPFYPELSFVFL